MIVQEYRLKFNKLSRYALHIVSDSRDQMNKFSYGVLDLVKTECINAILLRDMNISTLMTHTQPIEGDNLREQAMENNKASNGNYDYSQQKSGGVNRSHSQQNFSASAPSSTSILSSKNKYDQKGRAPGSKSQEMFHAPKLTPLVLSVVRIIRPNIFRKRKIFWVR